MKVKYIGELSGVVLPDLGGMQVKRGVPFEAPKEWFERKKKQEPKRWAAAAKQDDK